MIYACYLVTSYQGNQVDSLLQVGTLHTEMVKWMVQLLLRLAPDKKEHSAEAREAVLLGSATVRELQNNAKSLFQRLESFSKYVTT